MTNQTGCRHRAPSSWWGGQAQLLAYERAIPWKVNEPRDKCVGRRVWLSNENSGPKGLRCFAKVEWVEPPQGSQEVCCYQ